MCGTGRAARQWLRYPGWALAAVLWWVPLAGVASDTGPVLPLECSGVPSDPGVPDAGDRADPATHGPGASGEPVSLRVVKRPFGFKSMPPLYVFDSEARAVLERHEWLKDEAFAVAWRSAYWGELVDGEYFSIPSLAACELMEAVGRPIGLRAPEGGLLFVQFVSSRCRNCRQLSEAIAQVVADHPQLPFRWVQISTSLPVK